MPNWCSTVYRFYSDTEEGTKQLEQFYERLEKAIEPKRRRALVSDFGDGWLGNVILETCPHYLKFTSSDSINCEYNGEGIRFRGSIVDIRLDADSKTLDVETETAWEPMPGIWDMILAECGYTDIKYVYQAEEPSCELYINTDTEGRFFSDRYHVEVYVHDDFYCNEVCYLSSEEELLEFENQLIADLREEYKKNPDRYYLPDGYNTRKLRKQKTEKAARRLIEDNLFENLDGHGFIAVHRYTNE